MSQICAEASSIAEAFVSARREARPLGHYPGTAPADLATALAIQDAAIPQFGDRITGWKVGRINSPWLEQLGTNRLPGPIFAAHTQSAPANGTATGRIFAGGFGAAEAEFIFRLGRAPAARTAKLTMADAADLVDAVFVGIEIASSPFPGINALGPLVTISDFGNNNGLILGAEIPDWQGAAIDGWTVESRIDGQLVGTGRASAFDDGTLGSVQFLIQNLIDRGLPIEPGLLISTGAITGVHEIAAGQHFEARFGAFGTIACTIENAAAR